MRSGLMPILSEQVLVAYENRQAGLCDAGFIRKKQRHAAWDLSGLGARRGDHDEEPAHDDKPYFVNMVPWSTFFKRTTPSTAPTGNDRFGWVEVARLCINVAPLDARYVFELLKPAVPPGWTSVRPTDVTQWPMLYVHDSGRRPAFHQDRPIGAPDREDESERFEETNRLRIEQGLPPLPPPGTKPPAAATPGVPAAAARFPLPPPRAGSQPSACTALTAATSRPEPARS